ARPRAGYQKRRAPWADNLRPESTAPQGARTQRLSRRGEARRRPCRDLPSRVVPAAPSAWTEKGRHDFVTDADRTAEALIAGALMSEVPGSSVVGEELSPAAARTGAVVWIVDPLDGTTNFLHGYPQYAVSIGALVGGALGAGVVHDVARNLVYWAATGHGAWLGERRLHVSGVTEPRHALVGTGFPFKDLPALRRYLDQFSRVMGASSGIRRAGSAALDLVDVAAGRL